MTVINDEVAFDSYISLAALIDLKFDWKGFFESNTIKNSVKFRSSLTPKKAIALRFKAKKYFFFVLVLVPILCLDVSAVS